MISYVLDGYLDSRIVEFLRGAGWGLTPSKAKAIIARAHKAIGKQGPRPIEWHRCNALRLFGSSLANADHRVALESHKDMGRLDGIHDGEEIEIELDGSAESVTKMLQEAIMANINGKLSNNRLQAIMPALRELQNQLASGEEEGEDLGAIDVSDMSIRDATSRILGLGAQRRNKKEDDEQ